jgi:hypothetical protein
MKPCRILLDVDRDGNEILIDGRSQLRIAVRLGLQPSACPSGRRRAKVHQHRFVLRFCLAQRGINVFIP